MLLIAHRGNTDGPNEKENRPSYIVDALSRGYDAEVDLWWCNSGWFTGHDKPQYQVSVAWLGQSGLWIHAKTVDTFSFLLSRGLNVFYHTDEEIVLTTGGYIWVYPGVECHSNKAIIVQQGKPSPVIRSAYGVCSDYVSHWK